jgi:hypothetical protein
MTAAPGDGFNEGRVCFFCWIAYYLQRANGLAEENLFSRVGWRAPFSLG